LRFRSYTEWRSAGFDFGTIRASRFEVKVTGLSTSPCPKRRCVFRGAAEAKISAGAPFRICVSSVFEPAKLYRCAGSNDRKTSVSEAAA
jgi:hypothetical protein